MGVPLRYGGDHSASESCLLSPQLHSTQSLPVLSLPCLDWGEPPLSLTCLLPTPLCEMPLLPTPHPQASGPGPPGAQLGKPASTLLSGSPFVGSQSRQVFSVKTATKQV